MAKRRLQDELKKRTPFASLQQEATLNMFRANDRIVIRFSRLFRDYGLTPAQYNILRILRGENAPLPILEIGARLITVVPGITGLIDRLEEAGFVRRKRCERDRRVIYVAITDKGTQTLAELDRPVMNLHERLLAKLSSGELKQLILLLEKVREATDEANEEANEAAADDATHKTTGNVRRAKRSEP